MIPVAEVGGTVVLTYPQSDASIGRWALIHDFWVNNSTALTSWARLNGVRYPPGQIVLPALPPGEYTACVNVPIVFRGGVPDPRLPNCTHGVLAPFSQLVLEVPSQPGQEAGK